MIVFLPFTRSCPAPALPHLQLPSSCPPLVNLLPGQCKTNYTQPTVVSKDSDVNDGSRGDKGQWVFCPPGSGQSTLTLFQESEGLLHAVGVSLVTSNHFCHPGTLVVGTHSLPLRGKPHLVLLVPGAGGSLRRDGDTQDDGEGTHHTFQCLFCYHPSPTLPSSP